MIVDAESFVEHPVRTQPAALDAVGELMEWRKPLFQVFAYCGARQLGRENQRERDDQVLAVPQPQQSMIGAGEQAGGCHGR